MLLYYLHNLDPILLPIYGNFGIRWYGMSYIAGFICGYFFLVYCIKKGILDATKKQAEVFVVSFAILGVILGGRLGYKLFYDFETFARNPLTFFNLLEGGMSSHGGIIGATLMIIVYALIKKVSIHGIASLILPIAPLGIFFGRIANFINGELYGYPAPGVKWAMQFPKEIYYNSSELYYQATAKAKELGIDNLRIDNIHKIIADNPAFEQYLREVLTPRYPSQLVQALGEGLLLFIILMFIRLTFKNLYNGVITGLFFILYAIFRILAELFREPDSALILNISKGQFYSYLMIPAGLGFIIYAIIKKEKCVPKL